MGVKQTLTNYTIDDVRNLAEMLKRYAVRYEELAGKMSSTSIESLSVPNQKSMEDGMEKLRRHIAEAEISYNEQLDRSTGILGRSQIAADPAELYFTPVGKGKSKPTATTKVENKSNQKRRAAE